MEKQGTAGQATEDNVIRRIHIACWVTKATDTRSENVSYRLSSSKMVVRSATRVLLYIVSVYCHILKICSHVKDDIDM